MIIFYTEKDILDFELKFMKVIHYFNITAIRARIGVMTFCLQGLLYVVIRNKQTNEIKQANGFKRYTCQVVKKTSYLQYKNNLKNLQILINIENI